MNTEWARFELGAMHNVGTRSAVGGTFLVRASPGDSTAFGAKARYRRWLSRTVALEVSTGMLFSGPGTAPGFAGHLGAMVWDEVGFSIEAETIPPDFPEPKRLGWSASLRLGAHAGLVAGALVALLAAVCCVD